MKRRDAIKNASLLLGYTMAVGTSAAIMNGCKAEPQIDYKPEFFNLDQIQNVMHIAERILPETDTPGAIKAGVHTFIDQTISRFWDTEDQEKIIKDLDLFGAQIKSSEGKNFHELEPTLQDQHIGKLAEKKGDKTLFKSMRELTVSGFFTSELGQTEVLNYNPVPGPYQGCVDYIDGTPMDTSHPGSW